jgi:hypothetical protein
MRILILILLFPLVSFGQTKLSQLERSSTRWDLPVAYRNVNGTYAQGYLGFLEYLDSINYSAPGINVVIPGYGIEGFITNDTLVLYADTTELQRKLTLTISGTSGPATLTGGTLNIPQYTAGISGTGTQYKVPRWLTSSSLENSATPLWDYNGIVGVGQTGTGDFSSNTRIFQVYQPSGSLTAQYKSIGSTDVFQRYENGNGNWNTGIQYVSATGGNEYQIRNNLSTYFKIYNSGQLNIPNLIGTGTRMVTVTPNGTITSASIPGGANTDLYYTNLGTGIIGINSTTQTGSPIRLNAGTNTTLTYTDPNNITISSSGGGGATNLSFSGTTSPVTLNSSTGTDVTFTAGSNVTFSATGSNITIAASGGSGSLPAGTQNQTLRHNGTTWVSNDALRVFGVGLSTEYVQAGSFSLPFSVTSGTGSTGTRLAVNGGIQLVPQAITSTGLSGLSSSNNITRITVGAGLSLTNNTLSVGANYAYMAYSSLTQSPTTDIKYDWTASSSGSTGSPTPSTLNDNFTINQAGTYEINFNANVKNSGTANEINLYIRVNSSNHLATRRNTQTTVYESCASSLVIGLNAGDTVDVWIDVTSNTFSSNSGTITIKRIQ